MKYLIEVKLEWRPGRGRWWMPQAMGYTDDLSLAGIYTGPVADRVAGKSDRSVIVSVDEVIARLRRDLEPLRRDLEALEARL